MEKEMSNLLVEFIKPALLELIKRIDKGQYWEIYFTFLIIILIVIIIILFLSWLFAQRKIKSEILKNSADFKEKQLSNLEKIKSYRRKYLDNTILLQMATTDITEAFKSNDTTKLKSTVQEYRDIIFNDLIESFEEYIDAYEIMYQNEKYRFNSLFTDDFIPLIKTITNMMTVLNNDTILLKIDLLKYKIEKYVFRSIKSYFRRNLSRFRIIKRVESYFIVRKLLKQNGA